MQFLRERAGFHIAPLSCLPRIDACPHQRMDMDFHFAHELMPPEAAAKTRTDRIEDLEENIRILLVEDEVPVMTVFEKILALRGWQIQAVDNAADAIRQWEDESIDLIFMDLQMPKLNGLEATRIIRRLEMESGRRRVPIIALTAWCRPEDRQLCMEAGMDDYLPKPIHKDELYAMVEKHLTKVA